MINYRIICLLILGMFSICEADPLYIDKKVVVISSGLPGVGKTTLLRELNKRIANSVYLDKDVIANPFIVGLEETFYQSAHYHSYVKTQLYTAMLRLAEDNLREGSRVVLLDGYFGNKLSSSPFKEFLHSPGSSKKVIHFYCSQAVNEARLRSRGAVRDLAKFADHRRYFNIESDAHAEELKKHLHLQINTESDMEANIVRMLEYIRID